MEFDLFKTIFKDTTPVCFDDIHKHLKNMPREERLLMPNVIIVSQLLLVNPATSATPERSFSLARRVKTWLRSTMAQKRFNGALSILSSHKDLADTLDLISVGNEFVSLHDSRFYTFRKICSFGHILHSTHSYIFYVMEVFTQ